MAWPRNENATEQNTQNSPTLDTTRKEEKRQTTHAWRRTVTSELEEMGYSWGQAQFIAKDRVRWRQLVESLCPTGDEEDK